MIRPFNNSLLFITTVGGFFIQKTCGSYSERIEVFRNPVLKIPLHCTIESPELNITKFETIYTLYNYEPVDELHTIDSEDFYPIYQHPDNEADIADDEMATKINELFNLHMRQTTNQRKQYENRDFQSRVKDTVNNGVDGFIFFKLFCCLDFHAWFQAGPLMHATACTGLNHYIFCIDLFHLQFKAKTFPDFLLHSKFLLAQKTAL